MRRLGKELRKYRVDQELSGTEFGEIVGVNTASVSHVETGRRPMPVRWLAHLPDYFKDIWLEDMQERGQQRVNRLVRDEARRESA